MQTVVNDFILKTRNGQMRNTFRKGSLFIGALAVLAIIAGCTTPGPAVPTTSRRPSTQSLPGAILDQITVEDLRSAADLMARDLILQPFVLQANRLPIVAIKPIENKTDLKIDPDIFQKTIRVKLMEGSGGKILFRDEESHKYTIEERLKQSGKVQVESTTTKRRVTKPTRVGQPLQTTTSSQTQTRYTEEGAVKKKVADADYFLTGLIFSTTEVAQTAAPQGMRYFQFQFRITDAQTNIIMWEKEYRVKREGTFK